MNIENLKKLRDSVNDSRAFDMGIYGVRYIDDVNFNGPHYCGAPACIAGHAVALIIEGGRDIFGFINASVEAIRWLELDQKTASNLFKPCEEHEGIDMWDVTQSHAVRCLDHLIETGEVDWMATS